MEKNSNNRLNVLERGALDTIACATTSTSMNKNNTTAKRSGSRPPVVGGDGRPRSGSGNSTRSRLSQIGRNGSGSLEMLNPEELSIQNFELDIEEYGTSDSQDTSGTESDGETSIQNTGRSSQMFGLVAPKVKEKAVETTSCKDLAFINQEEQDRLMIAKLEAEGSEIDSEEENDIMNEIRQEIQEKMRGEMRDELVVYQQKKERLEKEEAVAPDSDLDGMEPKLKEAMLKMRKLDRILAKKMKREKEVKKQRILLGKQLRDELKNIKPEGRELKEVSVNTEKFLALAPPPSHNEGVLFDEPSPPVTPVFQTQLPDDGTRKNMGKESADLGSCDAEEESGRMSSVSLDGSEADSIGKKRKKQKKGKDFIRRNVELASDAANYVAMTDDEKTRLKELLKDIDDEAFLDDMSLIDDESNQQVAVPFGHGYLPTSDEMKRLNAIDERLKHILPPEEFESIASTPRSWQESQATLFTRTEMYATSAEPGEEALRKVRDDRDVQQRLDDIERQLGQLQVQDPFPISTTPTLSKVQLNDLLNQCARTMSRTTSTTCSVVNTPKARDDATDAAADSPLSPHSESSEQPEALTELYNNPPSLPEEVLHRLIADAKRSLMITTSAEAEEETPTNTPHNERLVLQSISEASYEEDSASQMSTLREESHDPSCSPCSLLNRPPSGNSRSGSIPFLPQIDPKGTLSTQKLNNSFVPASGDSVKAYSVADLSRSYSPTVSTRTPTLSAKSNHSISSPHPPLPRTPAGFIDNLHDNGGRPGSVNLSGPSQLK